MLRSLVRPDRISSPITRTAAVMVAGPLMSKLPLVGGAARVIAPRRRKAARTPCVAGGPQHMCSVYGRQRQRIGGDGINDVRIGGGARLPPQWANPATWS